MSIRVAMYHKTVYQYDRLVTLSPQTVRLRPAAHSRTAIQSYSLTVEPKDHFINWQQDPQGNFLARLTFPNPTSIFSLAVDLTAEMTVVNPFDFFLEPYAETYPFEYDPLQARELAPFLEVSPAGPKLAEWLAGVDRGTVHPITFLVDLNRRPFKPRQPQRAPSLRLPVLPALPLPTRKGPSSKSPIKGYRSCDPRRTPRSIWAGWAHLTTPVRCRPRSCRMATSC